MGCDGNGSGGRLEEFGGMRVKIEVIEVIGNGMLGELGELY